MLRFSYLLLLLLACVDVSAGVLSKTEINVFLDLTTTSINRNGKKVLDKWESLMSIHVVGDPTQKDSAELKKVVYDINYVMGREVVSVGEFAPNLLIFFTEAEEFKQHFNMRQIPAWSFILYIHNDDYTLDSVILYVDKHLLGDARKAAIRGGVTRALGFTGASRAMKYTSFYEKLSVYSPEFSKLEKKFIQLIFHDDIKAGMTRRELHDVLSALDSLEDTEGVPQKRVVEQAAIVSVPSLPKVYHLYFNGAQEGPYNRVQLEKMLSAGRITATVLAWKEGTPAEWKPVRQVLSR